MFEVKERNLFSALRRDYTKEIKKLLIQKCLESKSDEKVIELLSTPLILLNQNEFKALSACFGKKTDKLFVESKDKSSSQ